ncbi:two-component regulator propeller domain-containing protein [Persicobacter diffluens]|uniref:histidine kinase n=1 Tax=Persicobacter diffluens TaxID=981 RepID=A0AAN4W475_9BACT|nr:hypothetical protein PEDI_49330 [Persicobacter diffluens]
MIKRYFVIFFALFHSHCLSANADQFTTISRKEGLSHSVINCIVQDQTGFMWFGTQDGLIRYDGYQMKVFRPDTKDPQSIYDSWLTSTYVDSKNRIWVRFESGGISVYNPIQENFHTIIHDPQDPKSISNDMSPNLDITGFKNSIVEDGEGYIWVATINGLNRIHPETFECERFFEGNAQEGGLNSNYITTLYFDPSTHLLWVGTDNGIAALNTETLACHQYQAGLLSDRYVRVIQKDEFNTFWFGTRSNGVLRCQFNSAGQLVSNINLLNRQDLPENIRAQNVYDICINKTGEVWLAMTQGLYRLSQTGQIIDSYLIQQKSPSISCLTADLNGNIWAGGASTNNGLIKFDYKTEQFQEFLQKDIKINGYSNNIIYDLLVDRTGVLWVGTGKGGLIKYNTKAKPFLSFNGASFNASRKSDEEVYSLLNYQGSTFVGTKTSLFEFNQQDELLRKFPKQNNNDPKTISSNVVGCISPSKDGQFLWIGYFEGKVSKYDLTHHKFTHYAQHDPSNPHLFPGWSLRAILVAKDGTAYFGAMSGGLHYQSPGSDTFEPFHQKIIGEYEEMGAILCLMEDKNGKIWIGTTSKGLFIFDPQSGQLDHLGKGPSKLSHNEVRTILEAGDGTIWIGTRYGLNAYKADLGQIHQYFTKDGLPSNIIHGLLEDEKGNIWMSTNNGISRLNPELAHFTNFTEEDGLPSNEYNECAFFKDQHGMLYFGGPNGFTKFDPSKIQIDNSQPNVYLSNLQITQSKGSSSKNSASFPLDDQNINEIQQITLPYFYNSFDVSFSTLDFRVPKKIKYRYRLVGYDSQWHYTPINENSINYAMVMPGDYQLEIQATNADGKWSSQVRKIQITLQPPWWQTLFFKVFFSFLIGLLGLAALFWYIKDLKKRKAELSRTVEEKTRELLKVNQNLESQKTMILEQNKELQQQQSLLKKHQHNIETLGQMGQKITSNVELSSVFNHIFESVKQLMIIDELMIGQTHDDHLNLWGIRSTSMEISRDQLHLDKLDRLSAHVVKTGKVILSNHLAQTAEQLLKSPHEKYAATDGPKSGIYIPLYETNSNQVKGVLVAISYRRNAYDETHQALLNSLASYISIAMDNASAYEKIRLQTEQLLKVDQIKSDFYTNVSHEFRTPLTLIQGPISELKKLKSKSGEERELLNIVSKNAQLLLHLVEQIMELSRIDGGAIRLKTETHALLPHYKSILSSFEHLAIQKSITFIGSEQIGNAMADYDYDLINKVSYNLLNNAIKYTPEGGTVRFEMAIRENNLKILISDNGPGISKEELPHIFDRFYRLNVHENMAVGTGIGLSLVKQLVDLAQGEISVKSTSRAENPQMQGTTFDINIPLENIIVLQEGQPRVAAHESTEVAKSIAKTEKLDKLLKTKILVVEDNQDLRSFIINRLKPHYQVLSAENGRQALDIALDEQPHIVLSDIMMPVMDGIKMCQELKANISTSHIPVILITAKDAEADRLQGLQAGASDYITKPFKFEELHWKVENILRQRLALIDQFRSDIWTGIQDVGDTISPQDQDFLEQIKNIIEEEIENPNLDIEFFCSNLGVSRTWLYNKMKSLLDMSMNEFIRSCRLKHGAKLLITEKISVSQVAYAVGFNDPKYFTRCFKKEFGIGPKAYVNQQAVKA